MTSFESNRKLPESNDLASEQSLTNGQAARREVFETFARDGMPPEALASSAEGGREATVVDLCPGCGAPNGRPYVVWLPARLRSSLRRGPNGGVWLWRRVPGTGEWIGFEYFPPDDEHDDFWPVEPRLPIKIVAIILGLTVKTLYARAPFMASSEKHGGRMFFKRDLLFSVDAANDARVPSREEVLAEREARRARGEVRRAGSHHPSCDRRHDGACSASRRARPSERDRSRTRRSILDDLGK